MELNFESLSVTFTTDLQAPFGLTDENLYLVVKKEVQQLLQSTTSEIFDFGYAPDNDADDQEELLNNGTFIRIVAPDYLLGIDTDAQPSEVKKAFLNLFNLNLSTWCSIFDEQIGDKRQITIEILFKE